MSPRAQINPDLGQDGVLEGPCETVMTELIVPATQAAFPGEFTYIDCLSSIVLLTV